MDRIEAMKLLSEIKHYLTAGNPVWDKEVVAEACDMAIEALQNLSKPNNGLQGSELISIQMAIEHWGRSSGNLTNDQIAELQRKIEPISSAESEDRLYIKIYANDEPSRKAEKLYQICGETESQEVAQWLKEYFPSADRPKTGHWVEIEDYNGDIHYQCDQCREEFILIDGTPEDNNYWHCPNCGSYNREVRKNED